MIYSKKIIDRYGENTGFIKNNIEKVIRLLDVLNFLFSDSVFKDKLVLKGGTAINLVHTDLKRLSVDIDLDYHGSINKQTTFLDRELLAKELDSYMLGQEYSLSSKSRGSVALLSKMYGYTSAGGNADYIKVEINFMDRISLYGDSVSTISYFGKQVTIKTPVTEELFGMKLAALIDRSKPRDLYDATALLDTSKSLDKVLLKKAVIFYLTLDGVYDINNMTFEKIKAISQHSVKTELLPVLKKAESFDLEVAKESVIELLNQLLSLDEFETQYLKDFSLGNYDPSLLFDKNVAERASKHPMAKWKVTNIKK